MFISQKCQYAMRAVFELAYRTGSQPVSSATIAEAQAIPPRFLEVILGQLKKKGFVRSARGVRGGYSLAVSASELTVGDIIHFIDGPVDPVRCLGNPARNSCPLKDNCAFDGLWAHVRDAVAGVYDATTYQALVDDYRVKMESRASCYSI